MSRSRWPRPSRPASAASRSGPSSTWAPEHRWTRKERPVVGHVDASDVAAAVADAHRREWAFVLAATVRVTRDLDLAEECVQDSYAQALVTWAREGIPGRPGAWLTTTSCNRALDALRRDQTARKFLPLLVEEDVTQLEEPQ